MSWNDARNATPSFDYKPQPWMADAACIGHDPELWFPDDRGRGGEAKSTDTAFAKSICGSCPVRVRCLEYAMQTEPGWTKSGIWGGLTADARRGLKGDAA